MPYATHGLRHDVDALFERLLRDEKWPMTPCVVLDDGAAVITLVRLRAALLLFRDDAQVICGWPGAKRQDVFEFTVGAFRAYARDHNGGREPMTGSEGQKVEHPGEQMAGSAILLEDVLTRLDFEKRHHSQQREMALAITKAEEALLWVMRAAEKEVAASKADNAPVPPTEEAAP